MFCPCLWFRRGFSVVNCLLPMIEKWRESLDQCGAYGALLTDLSKAFDCSPHELIIAKLYVYGVDIPSLKLINSYLSKKDKGLKLMMFTAHGRNTFWGASVLHSWSIIIQYIYM